MSCVMCESYGVQLRPAVDVHNDSRVSIVHLLVCYLNKGPFVEDPIRLFCFENFWQAEKLDKELTL